MSASRRKRLELLERERQERNAAEVERVTARALELMTSADLETLRAHMERQDTPEAHAALKRLGAWGDGIPEVRDAPDLGAAGAAWWGRMLDGDALAGLPPVTPEALADVERHAGQWRELADRGDCPEQETAEGLAALWNWWAALARALLEERAER